MVVRRLGVALIILWLLASSVASASVEVGGYAVEPAVEMLKWLGVVGGDPGGDMRLGAPITRAELVRIIVAATGQEAAARTALDAAPAFVDVRTHWARGYIAIAKRMEITSGYADGTFRPDTILTYAEALTMLLRASGVQPVGAWPQAYIEAARRAGVLDSALEQALPPSGLALRGGVFLLAARSFTRIEDGAGQSLLQRTMGADALAAADRAANGMIAGYFVQPALDLLRRLSIVGGDSSGFLRLGSAMTRAELVKIAVSARGLAEAARTALSAPAPFADVKEHWARGYIAVALREGIADGYADGTFRPESPVTHAEALTILMRASGQQLTGAWPQAYVEAAGRAGVWNARLQEALPLAGLARRAAVFVLAERCFTLITDQHKENLLQRAFQAKRLHLSVEAQGVEEGVAHTQSITLMITAPTAAMALVNGKIAARAADRFVLRVDLSPGRNDIFIIAADAMGAVVTQQLVVERR